MITASCGLEPGRIVAYKPLVDQAIEMARSKPERCLVLQRPELRADLVSGRDQDFEAAVTQHRGAEIACVSVKATDPLYILYTSGTTGQPKGVVRDNGGHMVALNWSMRNIYGLKPGEVFWTASDIGWVVGHSYIVYAPLISGVTTLIFEGKPVGTRMPARSGVLFRNIMCGCSPPRRRRSALFGGRTATASCCGSIRCRICGRCFLPARGRTRRR
ncbi:acyl-coenzyme A synthetase/AMP-(fatty) acid ligase [Rhizobium leguminosarum]|uniref:Acyl-coenzyme A synthetase/AMP-(Fatty) acid ligase n=1 Tax=Rhizobium leguminosarum TaxID=384 RepID=A0A7X0DUY2_RHILE|nr:acyl-coenzyme A synthetase/AMP-(fatty) acid ligase [Rhizobium leguminosarum]